MSYLVRTALLAAALSEVGYCAPRREPDPPKPKPAPSPAKLKARRKAKLARKARKARP